MAAAHAAAFEPFVDDQAMSDEEKGFLRLVNQTFDHTGFDDFLTVSAFAKGLFEQNLAASLPESRRATAEGYFAWFYSVWENRTAPPSWTELEGMVDEAAGAFSARLSEQEAQAISAVSGMDYATYNGTGPRRSYLMDATASLLASEGISVRPFVIERSVDLGEAPLIGAEALTDELVASYSIPEYPISMPLGLLGQLVSEDGTTALILLTYAASDEGVGPGQDAVPEVRRIIDRATGGTAIRTYVTGSDPISVDMEDSTFRDLELIEPVTIVLVLVLIGLFFRSFVASSVPPLSIGIALGITYGLVYLIGYFVLPIHYSVITLLLTSMMGAGCDYCIFILARYREERRSGRDRQESVRQSVMWAGESIATSGATVVIGFGVLAIGRFDLFRSMGIALSLGVAIALLVALTLLPSLLLLLGDRMFWPAKLVRPANGASRTGYFTRSARFAIKHAKAIVVVALLVSVPTTYLALTVETSYDYIGAMPDTESKEGLNALQSGFGAGKILPTQIALRLSEPVISGTTFNGEAMGEIRNISESLLSLSNVKTVVSPAYPNGNPVELDEANLSAYRVLIESTMLSADDRSVLVTVTFEDQPFAQASIGSIQEMRGIASAYEALPLVENVYIGGATASMFDVSIMIQDDFALIEVLVVVGIYLVLLVVLGSVINPLRSILTILLSISWTLAVTMLLFQYLLGISILYMVPLILLVVCLGLGMDYDILLTTRVREEAAKGRGNDEAIVHAVERTGGIITACGIIMSAAFGTMLLSNGYLLKEFGFALMFAILLDATVVRIYLVPAIMSLLGKWNWWAPGPLALINRRRDQRRIEHTRAVPLEDGENDRGSARP